jgi:hypothetical protein
MLVWVAIASVVCLLGLHFRYSQAQRSARAWVKSQDGFCYFKYDHDLRTDEHNVPNVPSVLLKLLGPDFFNPVERVSFDFAIVNDLSQLEAFSELREINFNIEFGPDVDFSPLADFPNLSKVTLSEYTRDFSPCFDRDVSELRRLLPNVELVLDCHRR